MNQLRARRTGTDHRRRKPEPIPRHHGDRRGVDGQRRAVNRPERDLAAAGELAPRSLLGWIRQPRRN
ncbi:hypothetical protein [Alloactinosynnema sp. L-07]|nr:hypothetical protein [Alloactinosynnema sp. L-07]